MKYDEMLLIMEHTRQSAIRIQALTERARESAAVSQRLTAMYGKERVKGGDAHSDPVLKAVLESLERAEEDKQAMSDALLRLQKGRALVEQMPDGKHREILHDFYLAGWSYGKIRQMYSWKSRHTVYHNLRRALDALFERVK